MARVSLEQQRGVADMQSELAQANVSVDIERSRAEAARARAEGEAAVITTTGAAEATRTQAIGEASAVAEQALGLARATGFEAQTRAIGPEQTALVAALREVGSGQVKIVPDVQVRRRATNPGSVTSNVGCGSTTWVVGLRRVRRSGSSGSAGFVTGASREARLLVCDRRIGRTLRMRGSPVRELEAGVVSDLCFEDVWMPRCCGSCAGRSARRTGDVNRSTGGAST